MTDSPIVIPYDQAKQFREAVVYYLHTAHRKQLGTEPRVSTTTPNQISVILTAEESKALADIVWQSDDVATFGIFDGAQNKNIEPLIHNADATGACLYSGTLDYALKRAAPHLVGLGREQQLSQTLLRDGWLQNWGILTHCSAGTPMAVVKHHFRTLARALGPQGRKLVFRYYDPRVLGQFLPTCTFAEAQRVFGPCTRFLLPSPKRPGVEIYTLNLSLRTLDRHTIPIGGGDGASTTSIELTQNEIQQQENDFLRIRPEQYEQLSRAAKKQQLLSLTNLFLNIVKEDAEAPLEMEQWLTLKRRIPYWLAASQRFDLNTQRSMLSFLRLNHSYGEQFWQNPGEALDILTAQEESETKIAYLEAHFSQELMDQIWS